MTKLLHFILIIAGMIFNLILIDRLCKEMLLIFPPLTGTIMALSLAATFNYVVFHSLKFLLKIYWYFYE